eukprot:TRINITY_DN137029_c0_g1_i1.p1 TRINITY_DN137029_c0_g1~~TRINITY_DN137029_c0_g1_i1.p1  ORF type:complete len:745 (-),score=58.44 TRINITY_DN137029_c0_g1_i1:57-2291(-)
MEIASYGKNNKEEIKRRVIKIQNSSDFVRQKFVNSTKYTLLSTTGHQLKECIKEITNSEKSPFRYFAEMSDLAFEVLRPTLEDMAQHGSNHFPGIFKDKGRWDSLKATIQSLLEGKRKRSHKRKRRCHAEQSFKRKAPSTNCAVQEAASRYRLILARENAEGNALISTECHKMTLGTTNMQKSLEDFCGEVKSYLKKEQDPKVEERKIPEEVKGLASPFSESQSCGVLSMEVMSYTEIKREESFPNMEPIIPELPIACCASCLNGYDLKNTYSSMDCTHRVCPRCQKKAYKKHNTIYCYYCASYGEIVGKFLVCGARDKIPTSWEPSIKCDAEKHGIHDIVCVSREDLFENKKEITILGFDDKNWLSPGRTLIRQVIENTEVLEIISTNIIRLFEVMIDRAQVNEKLVLINCKMDRKCFKHFLFNSKSLKHICLKGCNVGDYGAETILKYIEKLKGLEELYLDKNCLSPNSGNIIAKIVRGCKKLKVLNINTNTLQHGAADIFKAVCGSKITHLSVNQNEISSSKDTLREMLKTSSITTLCIEDNLLGSDGAKEIAEGLVENYTLKYIWMRGNNVQDVGAEEIAKSLHSNSCLKVLGIGTNNITDKGAITLAKAIAKHKALLGLYMRYNILTKEAVKAFADALTENEKLRILGLNRVFLNDDSLDALVKLIHSAKRLEYLMLCGNNFSDEVKVNLCCYDTNIKIEFEGRSDICAFCNKTTCQFLLLGLLHNEKGLVEHANINQV